MIIQNPANQTSYANQCVAGLVNYKSNGFMSRGSNTISLPEYDGKTTHGVLFLDDGTQIRLTSGNGDTRYTNYRNNGHVEQKSALYMRENNISNATVYHNNTNGTCGYCNTMTATFLPEGVTLTVVPPKMVKKC